MEVSEVIKARRSIRKFNSKRVDRKSLEELVDYARLAASGRNKQPLEYVIVDRPKVEKEFFNYTSWAGSVDWFPSMEDRPRAYIVILANTSIEETTDDLDTGLAAANICLGAVDKGLGTCPLGALEEDDIKKLLDIPVDYEVKLTIGLGYPDQTVELEDNNTEPEYWLDEDGTMHVPKKPLGELLHINGW